MCVTHGLTSVNPRKHLIGHHMDWARGFPFAAFGLPTSTTCRRRPSCCSASATTTSSSKMQGEPWPGVESAERALEQEAKATGETLEALRSRKRAIYDRWLQEQTKAGAETHTGTAEKEQQGVASGG